MKKTDDLKITLISLHGLIRANEPELGRDADTGGQIKYLLELARELAAHSHVREVELLTRQIIDPRVSDDYAQLEEEIAENARIVRIPFGPKRYVRKESLWPYLELFIDQTLQHFRRTGLPDIIHGHYADAGAAGAQLARLLHIPYVFTSHSLGRVKRQRLSMGDNVDIDKLDRKYHFRTRIEAEEFALETAAMVVTSTNQEVEEQYQLYDHYQPERMEVIPPGVDLTSFMPIDDKWQTPSYAEKLNRFLREPDKPMILAMARPDERKNLETLVTVYGESEQLQEVANLVVVMGAREDYREMPKGQRMVIKNVLYLIDKYDLYGKVAYPKSHASADVPELYRLAASKKGVFVNPALTEPFGLTLLEAGATGLPIVATNDGGPRDIIANCKNGLLIDPLNHSEIEQALMRALTDHEQWEEWSKNGISGTREYYSWSNHANRYLRDLDDILEHSPPPVLKKTIAKRRLPDFDRLIITDLDNTLTGDDESLERFKEMLNENDNVGFGIATGRRLDSAMELISQLGLPQPDLIDTDCGTKLHYGENLTVDSSWRKSIGYAWNPDEIRKVLETLPGLNLQSEENQSEYKISYELDTRTCPKVTAIKKTLREAGLRAKVVLSLGMYMDVIPVRGGSDLSIRHVLWKWGFSSERVLVSGDSGNDAGMLLGRTLGVVVGNHSRELRRLRNRPRIYFAKAEHAGGILEGIEYYNFLDNIIIPNDKNE
ncbi:MAG: HAD family hydrolase [Planctomyces sp.]|nr:HAD family hydrolase [Planctomyces sp.]